MCVEGVILTMQSPAFTLYVIGRLRGITRERLARSVEIAGGRLTRRPRARVNLVTLSHTSAPTVLSSPPALTLPEDFATSVQLISERSLKRRLGLTKDASGEREFAVDEVIRATGLDPATLRCLVLFDVVDPVEGRFSFRDMRSGREARRLLSAGFTLAEVVRASMALADTGRGLFDTSIDEAPWGDLMQVVGQRIGRLNGQYELALDEPYVTLDEIFEGAEEAEMAGDLTEAERLYRIAAHMDRTDPVIPFNLGNVLDAQGRSKEALLQYQRAIARDETFAEGWVNLAALQEELGQLPEAEASLRRALQRRPDFDPALFNLARLLTESGSYLDALPYWDSYLALSRPQSASLATKFRSLCALERRSR
jgi:tetratricopeptide (TPR) repeat protein